MLHRPRSSSSATANAAWRGRSRPWPRVRLRPLADLHGVGIKRIKLAPPDVVLQLLGYPAGGVPPFGHCTAVQVLLDRSIAALGPGFVYAGGGDDRTMLQLTVEELTRVVQPQIISLSA